MGALIELDSAAAPERRRGPVVRGIIGELLEGKWRVISPLAEGGMGAVFVAEDVALEREVAVKFLSSQALSNPEAVARFEREARVMAQLDHPNLVPIHAFGRFQGLPFIVMKRLRGLHLRDWVRLNGHPELPMVRDLIGQLCDGLEHLHQHGVVHRDIKPNNIVVGPDLHLSLLDFGVARPRVSEDMTPRGSAVGSPRYMAPEQIVGAEVDCRADLYAVGVMLYELVTGGALYEGTSDIEILRHHVHTPPPDPASRNPTLPPALAALILRALAKSPQERFASAAALKQALFAALLPSKPSALPGAVTRIAKTDGAISVVTTRRPARAPSALVGVALLVAAALGVGWAGWRSRPAPAAEHVVAPTPALASTPAPMPVAAAQAPEAPPAPEPIESSATPSPPTLARRPIAAPKPRPAPAPTTRTGVTLVTLDGARPQWAWCDVDGKRVGCSPLTLSLEPGHHVVSCAQPSLDKRGAASFDVVGGRSQKLTIHLE